MRKTILVANRNAHGVLPAVDPNFDIRNYFDPEYNESFYRLKCHWKYNGKWVYNY